ncbi:hypothetical protein N825_09665 [Skermanella stibiiresistens SB22]|uniref:3-isopropylmalate dehydratase small subunit n=1 Tax=Skermanella stibiiresistens SB22 TaxID=1385369 RepID=W9GVL0_9PROT|nr:hypothetical protein [Skermanella stibiiresistens]EWY37839.1 hypothetical protein N825_09665 [Skermanella stibiiresistens SB22]
MTATPAVPSESTPISGRSWKLGHDIDTDQIIPSQYLVLGSLTQMATHCLETQRTDFAAQCQPGDIVVAGRNFGCGSSREQAPVVLKTLGVGAIVALGYARIFARNAINNALPVIVLPEAEDIPDGHRLSIVLAAGVLNDLDNGRTWKFEPITGLPGKILEAGGLINYLRAEQSA